MSEILNDLKEDISYFITKIRSIDPSIDRSKLSFDETSRLNENLSLALTEIDKMSENHKSIIPNTKAIFIELFDDTSKIKRDFDGLLRAVDENQIVQYKNFLFDDTLALTDSFRKCRLSLESLTYRPDRIAVTSVLYVIFGVVGLYLSSVFLSISSLSSYYISLYSKQYSGVSTLLEVFTLLVVIFLITSILSFVAGIGLWKMEKWGAITGLILAFINVAVWSIFLALSFFIPYMGNIMGSLSLPLVIPALAISFIFVVTIASSSKYF